MTTFTLRLTAVCLMGALAAPTSALAQEKKPRAKQGAAALQPSDDAVAPSEGGEDVTQRLMKDVGRSPRSRYAFAGGGVLLIAGLGFGYWAQGESKRAETIRSAADAQQAVDAARQSSATANVLFALALTTFAYGVALELLPQPIAERASLTFHF